MVAVLVLVYELHFFGRMWIERTAIDLTRSGIHSFGRNSISSLQYVKPLIDFYEKLADGEKVISSCHFFSFFHAFLPFPLRNYNDRTKMGKPSARPQPHREKVFASVFYLSATQNAVLWIYHSILLNCFRKCGL